MGWGIGTWRGMRQGRTFSRNLVRKLQNLLRPSHNDALLRLPRRLREQHGRDVRERERAQHEQRVQEADVLVRDAAWPEECKEARVRRARRVGEEHGRELLGGRWGGRRVEEEEHLVDGD